MAQLIRDIMHKGLITCLPETPLGQAATLLTQHHVHALIVANPTGAPVGVISDFDLLAGEWLSVDKASLATMKKLTAGDLMTSPIDSIDANADVIKAAQTMLDKQIHRLMVVDHDKPIGVVSISDIVASIAGQSTVRRETVGDVMSEAFLVCRSKATILSIARTMTDIQWRSVL